MSDYPDDKRKQIEWIAADMRAIARKVVRWKPAPPTELIYPRTYYVRPEYASPRVDAGRTSWQIDTSEGASTNYGWISGAIDGTNVTYYTSEAFVEGSLHIYWNGQELIPGAGNQFTEIGNRRFDLAMAIPNGKLLAAYETLSGVEERCLAQSEGTNRTCGTITGAIDGANTDYTLPGPYRSGKCLLTWNGQTLHEGTDQDWIELDPTAGTVRMGMAILAGVLGTKYVPAIATGWITDHSATGTLSGLLNGVNQVFTTRYPYQPGSLSVSSNGAVLSEGDSSDFTLTDPGARTFTLTFAPASTESLSATYRIAYANLSAVTGDYTIGVGDEINIRFGIVVGYTPAAP